MGRAPCCEKVGLKKGPWSPEEDRILISYIENFGHANWRALPKQAGLLRCGKSCRLRWMNYLRPDIKRGDFTREEEETIIKLHDLLGNRWSAIAARLPGRTDNEIKNVWHTHLKKKIKKNQEAANLDFKKTSASDEEINEMNSPNSQCDQELSPQPSCSSDLSTVTNASHVMNMDEFMQSSMDLFPPIDESFWSDISSMPGEYPSIKDELSGIQAAENCPTFSGESHSQYPSDFSPVMDGSLLQNSLASNSYKQVSDNSNNTFSIDDGMDFWYDIFMNSGEIPELTEF